MGDAYLLASSRTPIGKFLGAFQNVPAVELGAIVIRESLERAKIDPADVDEVIFGNVLSAGLGQAPARQAALKAGLPATVPAVTVNKVCGSGLKSVMLAAQAIRLGDASVIVAGGMENMTQSPHLLPGSRNGWKMGDVELKDSLLVDGLWCAFDDCHMGLHAEYTAEKYGLARDDLDRYSLESQLRAASAIADGVFIDEIIPVTVRQRKTVRQKNQEVTIANDEGPRPDTNLEGLSRLKPAFSKTGCVTAGNAAMLSDGAAAIVVVSREITEKVSSGWRTKIVASFTSGVEPRDLFIAPVEAIRGVLKKAGLGKDEIDLYEINEAFASQMLACLQELDLDSRKVNVNGGAIALGHPIGASGTRILVTLLSAMQKRGLRYGLASLCLGGGNAVAMIVEREAY